LTFGGVARQETERINRVITNDGMTRDVAEAAADHAAKISSNGHMDGAFPARVLLQPLAAPSILGYYSLAAASLVVGAHTAGWYGNGSTPLYLLTFVALFGGLAQFLAGMWAYRVRDGLATAIHSAWGAFFGAYGLLYLLVANGTLAIGAVNQNEGFWYIPLAAITGVGVFAALAENAALSSTLLVYAIGAGIAAIATLVGDAPWIKVSGWVFLLGALLAWYLGSALLLEGSWRRVILPLGRTQRGANRPGSIATEPVEYPLGEPGVRMGQ
jgi:succinate-acetate transporter protein